MWPPLVVYDRAGFRVFARVVRFAATADATIPFVSTFVSRMTDENARHHFE